MISAPWAVVRTTLKEFVRDRLVLICAFIAVLIFAFSLVLGALSFAEQRRILVHFGLLAIHLFSLIFVGFIGCYHIHKEIDRQTCLLVLARPISRAQFFLAKYFATWIFTVLSMISLCFVLVIFLKGEVDTSHLLAIQGIGIMEMTILLGFAMMLSQILRPSLALVSVLSVYFIGQWMDDFQFFARKAKVDLFIGVAEFVKTIFPNLFQYNLRALYFFDNGVPPTQLAWCVLHALGWAGLTITLGVYFFKRRDFV